MPVHQSSCCSRVSYATLNIASDSLADDARVSDSCGAGSAPRDAIGYRQSPRRGLFCIRVPAIVALEEAIWTAANGSVAVAAAPVMAERGPSLMPTDVAALPVFERQCGTVGRPAFNGVSSIDCCAFTRVEGAGLAGTGNARPAAYGQRKGRRTAIFMTYSCESEPQERGPRSLVSVNETPRCCEAQVIPVPFSGPPDANCARDHTTAGNVVTRFAAPFWARGQCGEGGWIDHAINCKSSFAIAV